MDQQDKAIRVMKDGPYVVRGRVPMQKWVIGCDDTGAAVAWIAGDSLPVDRDTYSLCRCGRSGRKPYCDGTHALIDFDGTETASRTLYLQHADVIDGPLVTLTDDRDLCAEARFCDAYGGLWNRVPRAEDRGEAEGAVEQAERCPAGRYTAWDVETGVAFEPDLEPAIGIVEDPAAQCSGPLWIRGGIPVSAADGDTYEVRNRVTLCRCGQSKNKPFCDGTHVAIKFSDEV